MRSRPGIGGLQKAVAARDQYRNVTEVKPTDFTSTSAIGSRKGLIVGLTCRVGRAISGHIDMVHDLLQYGESILFLGRPGVGKTTVMREMARVLADELHKIVVIIDTSNEIGGDGDIPHSAIGSARRMQVPEPSMQHKVMIEAVENHMPEVILVDEIGTEAESLACRSISERGVMLIVTAHGEVGGVETVTLGDDGARARRCQKTILERKGPPTFPFLIEMRERNYWVTHRTERSVDMLLHGKKPLVEVILSSVKIIILVHRSLVILKTNPFTKSPFSLTNKIIYFLIRTHICLWFQVRKRDDHFKVVIERWKAYDGDGI
ncbi:hypothetical protein MKX03_015065 [Papaver bracteatum]|nr:hypothetical protein MKX03_015065 [Papaver bracteatum]